MKIFLWLSIISIFIILCQTRVGSWQNDQLARPSPIQYQWHEQERIMFVCLDPCTWQGREYDDHSTPLNRINPESLNTDQWCEVARSWGAGEILFVAKHTGGFCWWQTETTDYGIKNTSYKNGKGDVLMELSASCKRYGLNLGVYIYPGDDTWGAGIGSGGRTSDPSKQESYNEVFRTQLTEVLTKYGDVMEVWFDGSCVIDVSDIMEKYVGNSVIFQGPHATLRWPGTESGKLFYPVWNSVKSKVLRTGVSTQVHGDPDGDAWAPLETNTTLYDHYWFWAPKKEKKRKSLDQLMECYYKSVGYGSVFLLNSTPDTTGLIPAEDVELYKAFGKEIDRRFKTPLASAVDIIGVVQELKFSKSCKVNHVITMEDYRNGHRIREYTIEGYSQGKWIELCHGQSIGRKKIDYFPDIDVSNVRLKINKSVGEPLIRSIAVYYVEDFIAPPMQPVSPWSEWQEFQNWSVDQGGKMKVELDLTGKIQLPGQYVVKVEPEDVNKKVKISEVNMFYDGAEVMDKFTSVSDMEIKINRTAQVTEESTIILNFTIACTSACNGTLKFKPALIY